MKSTVILLGILLSFAKIGAQENIIALSKVEQFCKTPGRTITGYLIYKDTYGLWNDGVKAIAMKYIDNQTKDSINGITFSYSINKGSGTTSVYRNFEALIDYDDFFKIISWFESCQTIISNCSSKIGMLSYTPQKGSFQLRLQKRLFRNELSISPDNWDIAIRFNRNDADSEINFPTSIDDIIRKLKAFKEKL